MGMVYRKICIFRFYLLIFWGRNFHQLDLSVFAKDDIIRVLIKQSNLVRHKVYALNFNLGQNVLKYFLINWKPENLFPNHVTENIYKINT